MGSVQPSSAAADHQDREAGNPGLSFPNGMVSGDEPILVIILKHTDRTNMYARLKPPLTVTCLIGCCLDGYMNDGLGKTQRTIER